MKILITAFEPFGEDKENASLEVMNRLTAPGDCELIKMAVPVVFGKAAEIVNKAIDREDPCAVICMGQAGRRNCISLERRAVNLCDTSSPDNEGNCPEKTPVIRNGRNVLLAALPIDDMAERLMNSGIPVELSSSAGTYVCNSLMYGMLYHLEKTNRRIPAGFIHVPYFREQTENKPRGTPFMELEEMVKGIQLCLECLNEQKSTE